MADDFLEKMGERIQMSRKTLGFTQEKTAELADVTYQTISLCEKGQSELKAKSIAGIAKALEMSADYLLYGRQNEYDLQLLDKRALGLSDRQFGYFKRFYHEFLEMCAIGEIE